MAVFTTACPRNCYSTCTFVAEVDDAALGDGHLRRVLPHAGNAATPGGACIKGLSYVERQHAPDRLLHPLRKDGDRHVRISWDEALDTIAEKLRALRTDPGPQSVLYYAASGTKGLLNACGAAFWRMYGGYTTTYGDLCWPAGLEATRLTLGANKHNAPWDLVNARLVVLWGKNAAETNIHQMRFIDEMLARGGRLVVVDPRRTETAERAGLLLQPRPGTDGALALAVAHLLVENGQVDDDFVEKHVLGFDAFRERVRAWTPQRAAQVCGVTTDAIETLADWLGTVHPATIAAGFGMQRYTTSGQTMRSILALVAITGNLGKPGAGWQFANLQSAIFDEVQDPIAFYPPEKPDGVARVDISTARLGKDMLATADPPLRMAWVERGNPIPQNPETNTVLEAFQALDFVVVVDQFLTDTARCADLVLPAKTMFEQTDVIGAYWHPYVQLRQKVLEPPGEVLPETEIYRRLAQRLGWNPAEVDARIPGPADADVERWLEEKLAPFPELTLERLREGPQLPPGYEEVAFAELRFETPSGKVELRSEEAAERWGVDPLPDWSEPAEMARGNAMLLLTPNTKNRIHSQFNNLPMIERMSPKPFVEIHPEDARERGIEDGEPVHISNERGEFTVEARYDHGLRRGVVVVTNGWWLTQGGAVNVTSLGRETDMGHGAAFHDNAVRVVRG